MREISDDMMYYIHTKHTLHLLLNFFYFQSSVCYICFLKDEH